VWQGEIYLELHRATLTTQSGVKKKHRGAERALITAETVAGLAHLLGGAAPESLEALWRVVLKNEFHDILPGSSIREVYEDAERGEEVTEVESIEVVEKGPHRAAVRVAKTYRHSRVTQTYALAANGLRLDVETEIDLHDRRVFLRSLTPVDVRASEATFECAFGVVRRPTHTNTSWDQAKFEVPGHRFADLSEPGFGLALLNNAKYGHSARGNVLGLSLVRAPVYPDPLADEGVQRFTYALMPHQGDWYEGRVRIEAEDLNQPLLAAGASGLAGASLTPLVPGGINAALSALKPAEDGEGLVLRVYEPAGRRGDFSLELPGGWKLSGPLTLLEEPMARGPGAELRPFEIRSWRLRRG
jgi:alpha-mannosidase